MADPLSLDARIAERLAAAAEARGESVDQLATEAIEKFLDWDDDFRAAVTRGVAEADLIWFTLSALADISEALEHFSAD